MASHKLQLYVTEEQYRYLKRCAGGRRSMAEVVRQLIDAAGRPADPSSDSFFRYVLQDKAPSGEPYSAEEAKRELYRQPQMRTVLVDSSAFLALDDPAERNHPQTVATFQELVGEGARLLTTNFVFDEAYTLLLVRLGRRRAVAWGESLRNSGLIRMERVDEDHEARAWEIILAFSDKDFSYTDATSFAVAENLGISEALSLDRHFHQFGALQVWRPPLP